MHPNAFLRSLWRNETLPQVFVAMSFEAKFDDRFVRVMKPAIEGERIEGQVLKAHRVDNSRSGDSILTEIVNGIAHSSLILADVSVVDQGQDTKQPIRNGNVMYEVGVALACRAPAEVLLVRDDNEKLLFDVSSVPHMTLDFDSADAVATLRTALADRLRETHAVTDARVVLVARQLTQPELDVLEDLGALADNVARDLADPALEGPNHYTSQGINGLLTKGCIRSAARREHEQFKSVYYAATPFGRKVLKSVTTLLPTSKPDTPDVPNSP